MFALQPKPQGTDTKDNEPLGNCTPNILPCRIHHDGPVKSLNRHWMPVADEKDKDLQTAHFRGRRLRGRQVQIPEGYEGVVATHTDREMPKVTDSEGTNEDGEPDEPVKVLEKQATFGEYIVWGHETIPAADDTFVKGVEEWVKFAEAIHTEGDGEKKSA
ncbi:hypothetical protein ASPSYDRAFT_90069 [Aspergillus sydowii CBS 593.65]|uniref:Uncharacterized protein n=1 Tax=Aspergillus sydowii CBS 593.65 TaxID=1036612 RepID=A0A1L9TEP8_9EURO|nr:uncharacterized protein ASPSYDRAFT_90069 [Aspergillus sydowii CBS 593.65]OJJ57875.1 hypothetical protein ASPSYDRAFT_90069 [Aspergillus sydowii CBS 593.65]